MWSRAAAKSSRLQSGCVCGCCSEQLAGVRMCLWLLLIPSGLGLVYAVPCMIITGFFPNCLTKMHGPGSIFFLRCSVSCWERSQGFAPPLNMDLWPTTPNANPQSHCATHLIRMVILISDLTDKATATRLSASLYGQSHSAWVDTDFNVVDVTSSQGTLQGTIPNLLG